MEIVRETGNRRIGDSLWEWAKNPNPSLFPWQPLFFFGHWTFSSCTNTNTHKHTHFSCET